MKTYPLGVSKVKMFLKTTLDGDLCDSYVE